MSSSELVRGNAWYSLFDSIHLEVSGQDNDGILLRVGRNTDDFHFTLYFGDWGAVEKMHALLGQTLEDRKRAQEFHAEPAERLEVVRD